LLTVKHILPSGNETLYLANRVSFDPRGPSVLIELGNHPALSLTGGTVFVMNEVGKTVSRYQLSNGDRP
jgi:hypothetical protein